MLLFFSSFEAAKLHTADVRTHSISSNVVCILGIFLTVFTVFSLEPFADTVVIVFFVHWQTLAVVLRGPAMMHPSKSMAVGASYKLATESSVLGVHGLGNFLSDNSDAKKKVT